MFPSQGSVHRRIGRIPVEFHPVRHATDAYDNRGNVFSVALRSASFDNDPSAGSPTETLLRLLLPLDDQV